MSGEFFDPFFYHADEVEDDPATDDSPDLLCDRCGDELSWPIYLIDTRNFDRVCYRCASDAE